MPDLIGYPNKNYLDVINNLNKMNVKVDQTSFFNLMQRNNLNPEIINKIVREKGLSEINTNTFFDTYTNYLQTNNIKPHTQTAEYKNAGFFGQVMKDWKVKTGYEKLETLGKTVGFANDVMGLYNSYQQNKLQRKMFDFNKRQALEQNRIAKKHYSNTLDTLARGKLSQEGSGKYTEQQVTDYVNKRKI